MTTRETIIEAIRQQAELAYAWKVPVRRKVILWSDVPPEDRPCCFMFEGGRDSYSWSNQVNAKRELALSLMVYTNAREVVGAIEINNILDALDGIFGSPRGSDLVRKGHTLDGLVASCRIEGTVLKETGDLDGDGLLLVPLRIILP